MKTIAIIIIPIFVQTINIFGQQNPLGSDSLINHLKGVWYVVNQSTQDSLVFKRKSNLPYNWGSRIEFNENGEFVDSYSARCGNDSSHHNDKGTWYIEKNGIIITSIPLVLYGKKNKILSITDDTLVLKKIQ